MHVCIMLYIYIYTHTHTHIHTNKTYIYTYATPWSTIHLQKLTGPQLFKKFPAFYVTRKFITVITSDRIYMYTHIRAHEYIYI